MKTKTSKVSKCYTCFVFFYLILNCTFGLAIGVFSSYLLLFRPEIHDLKPRIIIIYFLIVPSVLTVLSTTVAWSSIKRKKIELLKFFAVLLAITAILEIGGCLWCFASLSKVNDQALEEMQEKFTTMTIDSTSKNWWNKVQSKLNCCGLHGPTDYFVKETVPFSCCGSEPQETMKGSCSFLWQKGCFKALTDELCKDLILLSIAVLCIAFLKIPGIIITWYFANKATKEGI